MNLLLWRHAEAEDAADDMKRRLTERGERQARAMANWIGRHGPVGLRVLASPAVRAQQTARALSMPLETLPAIAPSATAGDLLAAIEQQCGDRSDAAIMLVGHQPALGELAALLLSGVASAWSIKKGALWWLRLRERGGCRQAELRAVVPPDLAE